MEMLITTAHGSDAAAIAHDLFRHCGSLQKFVKLVVPKNGVPLDGIATIALAEARVMVLVLGPDSVQKDSAAQIFERKMMDEAAHRGVPVVFAADNWHFLVPPHLTEHAERVIFAFARGDEPSGVVRELLPKAQVESLHSVWATTELLVRVFATVDALKPKVPVQTASDTGWSNPLLTD